MGNCLGGGEASKPSNPTSIKVEAAPPPGPTAAEPTAAPQKPYQAPQVVTAAPASATGAKTPSAATPGAQPAVPQDKFAPISQGKKAMASSVLGYETEDIHKLYQLGRELGRGQFGITHLCTDRKNGQVLACKSISKRKLTSRDDIEDVRREVAIMEHLRGHPNIVTLYGAYEDKSAVHLVMELCAGGELFDRIVARGHYTEKAAAELIRTILEVVNECHIKGVIHRDLKPENFLLFTKAENSPIKTTDFGLSVFYKPGDVFTDIVGSAYYVAPEVLRRSYGREADVWSVGVILYILLCGVPPFWAETEQGIFDAVLRAKVDFSSQPWPKISESAKDCVRRMLTVNAKERITAADALQHPWIRVDGIAPDVAIDGSVIKRLKEFSNMNRLKKAALKVIASSMTSDEISELKALFAAMDTDNSGTITFEELKAGLEKTGARMAESEVRALMNAMDVDNNGTLDYDEFCAATIQMNKLNHEDKLWRAFSYFDKDGSGSITVEELREVLAQNNPEDFAQMDEIIREFDTDNDGTIDYEEFVFMMRGTKPSSNRDRVSVV